MSMRTRLVVRTALLIWTVVCCRTALGANVSLLIFSSSTTSVNWSTANWSNGQSPTSADNVFLNSPFGTALTVRLDVNATVNSITVNNKVTFLITAGKQLTINASSNVNAGGVLELNSSNIAGNGPLSVNGELDIYGGTIAAGTGALNVNAGGLLAFWGSVNSARVLRSINNVGTMTFRNDIVAGNHFGLGGAVIWNTGTIDIQTDHDVTADAGTPVLSNSGLITKSAGSGTATINFKVDNASGATIKSQSGTLALSGGGTVSGTHSVGSGATVKLSGGTFTIVGSPTVTGSGTLNVGGATVNIGDGPGGSSDGWTSSSPITFTSGTMALKDANLSTSSTFSVSATVEHYGGSLTGSGSMTINSGGMVRCHGTDNHSNIAINTTVNSGGQIVYTNDISGAHQYGLFNNADIINVGTIDFQTDHGLDNLGGANDLSRIANSGTLKKSSGSGNTNVNVRVDTSPGATIQAQSGTLTFTKGNNFNGATISGAGTVALPAGHSLSGTTTISGTLQLTGNASTTGTANVGGTLLLNSGVDVTWSTVNLTASTSKLDGAGKLTINSGLNWSGGKITGSGGRIVTTGAAIVCSAGNCTLDGATLQLQGGGTLSASTNSLVLSNGATLAISGSTFNIDNDADIAYGSGTVGAITSTDVIRKRTGSGTSTIAIPLTTSGSAQTIVDAGTLQFSGGVTSGATTLRISAGTTLEVTGGVFLFTVAPSFAGSGTFKVSAGTLRVPSGSMTIPNVTLDGGTVDGAGTLVLSGTSNWNAGTMGSATMTGGITQIKSGNTLNISTAGAKTLTQSRELKNAGTVNYDGSGLTISNNGTLTNSGTFDIKADGNVTSSTAIANSGTFKKSAGSGTSTISPPLNNSGTVSVTAGTLALAGDGTHTGSFTATSPGILAFPSGTHAMSGAGKSISGTGTLAFSGSTATVGIPINAVGTLNVSAGTATLNAVVSANAFTLSGGTLGGDGAVTLTNGGTWSGGTMSGNGTTTNPASKTLTVSAPVTLSRPLQNDGTLTITAPGNIALPSGTYSIAGGGTIGGTGTLSFTGAAATVANAINNIGSLSVSAGTATLNGTSSAGAFSMTGGTLGGSGAVTLTNGGTWSAGTMGGGGTTTAAGTLGITGPVTLDRTLQNNGTLNAAGDIGGAGSITGTGTLSFSSGTAAVGVTVTAGALSVTGGNAAFNGTTTTAGTLTMSAGTLGGSGPVTLTNGGTWSGGTMNGTGITTNQAALAVSAPVTLGRTLQNDGTLNVSANVGGSGTIANAGTLNGTASSTISAALNNSGTVNVTSGTVALAGNGTHSGSFTATSPGTLAFSGGTHAMGGAGKSISGTGALTFSGATATVGIPINAVGTLNVSGGTATLNDAVSANAFTMSGGTLGGSGAVTLTNGGSWSGGTMGIGGTTTADGPLGITAAVSLDRTLQNNSTLTVSANVGGSGTIANAGTLNGTASSTISSALNNSGTVNVTSGTVALAGNGTHTGSFTTTSPGTLAFSGGTHAMSGGGKSISGTGALTFSGATATVGIPINGVGTLNVSAGTAAFNDAVSANAFTMSAGTLGGSGAVTLTNGGTWSGGTMGIGGKTTNPTAKTLDVTGSVILDRTLQNDGTLNVSGNISGSGTIVNNNALAVGGSATLTVALDTHGSLTTSAPLSLSGGGNYSGSFTINPSGSIAFTSGTFSITGGGTISGGGTLSFTGAATTIGIPVSVGTLSVTGGTATLDGTSGADAFSMSGGTLGGNGALTLNHGGSWSGGTMSGGGATTNAAGTLGITGPVTLGRTLTNAGTLNVSGDVGGTGTIQNAGTLSVNADSTFDAKLNNDSQLTANAKLTLKANGTHGGAFDVPGTLELAGGSHALNGAIGGAGTLKFSGAAATVANAFSIGTLNVAGGTATLNGDVSAGGFTMSGGTLDGNGAVTLQNGGTWSGGTISGNGTTTNPTAKTLNVTKPVILGRTLQNGGTLNVSGNVGGSGTIANNGTLEVLADTTISAALNNHGQLDTNHVLALAGNGSHNGTFTIDGAIDFSGGTHTILGSFTGTGTVRFSGAAATVNGVWSGMPIDVSGGSVALNPNGATPSLTMSGGTLGGIGNLTVTGASSWSGGTIGGSGNLTVGAGAVVTIGGAGSPTLQRALSNEGTIHFAAATNPLTIDGAAVTNDGTFDIQAAQNIAATPDTPPFANNGTLTKSGAGIVQFAAPLANAGTVQIGAGTLHVTDAYTQSAGNTGIAAGATLQTATLLLNGGSLTGNGTVAGTLENHAVVAPGASPGIVTVNGDYVQGPEGKLDVQLGGTAPGAQYDQLNVTGTATLDGTLGVTAVNGFVPATGDIFQVLTYGARNGAFAVTSGLNFNATKLVPAYGAGDLKLNSVNALADLATSVGAPSSVPDGSAFAYSVGVANNGPANATGVTFSAPLPPNVAFNSVAGASCTGAPNLLCTIGTLASGAAAAVTLNVTARSPGVASLTVSSAQNEFDPNATNNTASASTAVHAVADLQIAVSGPPSTIPTVQGIYTIQVLNAGPDTANNVVVTAAASPGLVFNGNAGACTGAFPCVIGPLAAGQTATITTAWTIDAGTQGAVQLSVSTGSATQDVNPLNNGASATTLVGACPAIVIDRAPAELIAGANASAAATLYAGATYDWSIDNGTIDSDDGAGRVTFTAGSPGTTRLTVTVTAPGCALSATHVVTVKPAPGCQGTASPTVPLDDATTGDVVAFGWTGVAGASGYRVWLEQPGVPSLDLGTVLGTSMTKVVAPGSYRWFVETLFDGCASHESERRKLTILGADDCAGHETPKLTAPAENATTSNASVAFGWSAVAGAIQYELWLAPAGGLPALVRATSDTSLASAVAPGHWEWFVRARFAGCPPVESEHRVFTYTPPKECRLKQRPLLLSPANRERYVTSPATFGWNNVDGAASYELFVDDVLQAKTTVPRVSELRVSPGEHRWKVRAHFDGCASLDSAESRFRVVPQPASCAPLDAPVVAAPAQISSGIDGRFQWSFVPGATGYVVETSTDPRFPPSSTSESKTIEDQQTPFNFTNETSEPVARYVRVHAVDAKCIPQTSGPFSAVAAMNVLPKGSTDGAVLLSDPADVESVVTIGPELAGSSFTVTPSVPWITVEPSSGVVPPGGQTVHAVAHTKGLPPGSSSGGVTVATKSTSITTPLSVTLLPPTSGLGSDTPSQDTLIVPLTMNVANVPGSAAGSIQSDLRITNTSSDAMIYRLIFVPSGKTGLTRGFQAQLPVAPYATVAITRLNVALVGGAKAGIGTFAICPPNPPENGKTTTDAIVSGLPDQVTFVTSYNYGATGGRYVPAIPYANFVTEGGVISLQHVMRSDTRTTSLGLSEASGNAVTAGVTIFDAATGRELETFTADLKGGENLEIDDVLGKHGIEQLDEGRIEVTVHGAGKVTAYATVGNGIDALFVPPARLAPESPGEKNNSKWVVPGVTDLGAGDWQTDVRIFNAGTDAAKLTLVFYPESGSSEPKTIEVKGGEMLRLDHVLSSLFGISKQTGALHVSSEQPAKLIVTAQTAKTGHSQFLSAVTPAEAVLKTSRALQLLQGEASPQRSSRIGLAEVSGNAAKVKVTVYLSTGETAEKQLDLAANESRELDLGAEFGLAEAYNARVGVSVVDGAGRVTAYLAVENKENGDVTYFPGQ